MGHLQNPVLFVLDCTGFSDDGFALLGYSIFMVLLSQVTAKVEIVIAPAGKVHPQAPSICLLFYTIIALGLEYIRTHRFS
jgi:hypothetical protein